MSRDREVGKVHFTTKPISLSNLRIGRAQARTRDLSHEIEELAESIRVLGLLEPIVVAPRGKDGKYEILSGQRRYLAHQALKLPTIMTSIPITASRSPSLRRSPSPRMWCESR